MVYTSYNLNKTCVAHAEATRVAHICFCYVHAITLTINYVPSCIGLYAPSPPSYMLGFILCTHVAGCDTRIHLLYFHRLATARPSYMHNLLSMF